MALLELNLHPCAALPTPGTYWIASGLDWIIGGKATSPELAVSGRSDTALTSTSVCELGRQ